LAGGADGSTNLDFLAVNTFAFQSSLFLTERTVDSLCAFGVPGK